MKSAQESSLFWKDISGVNTSFHGNFATYITHPCLRLAHRLTASFISSFNDLERVSRRDICHLWAMMDVAIGMPDWVELFLDSCETARWYRQGPLRMGGFVSLIAEYLKIDIPSHFDVLENGKSCLDLTTLVKLKMVGDTPRGYFWLYGLSHIPYLRLPRPDGLPLPFGTRPSDFYCPQDVKSFGVPMRGLVDDKPMDRDDNAGPSGSAFFGMA